jgi:hypothetical protein
VKKNKYQAFINTADGLLGGVGAASILFWFVSWWNHDIEGIILLPVAFTAFGGTVWWGRCIASKEGGKDSGE